MRIGLLVVGLLLATGCTTGNPPATEVRGVETSTAQPPTSATASGVQFFGTVPAVPKRIVFVIDHSGSMTDSIPLVKQELKRSVRSLRPNQAFWITFFSSGSSLDLPTGEAKLLAATEANKAAAYEFIDGIVAVGQTDPKGAIQKAFDRQPDVIYILTGGDFEPQVADLIAKLNVKKEVIVNTICFIYSDGEPLMKKIAEANNGTYKFVSEKEVAKPIMP
jgi:uncharacterized protein with von Willebrand factor type A (vWA) domain